MKLKLAIALASFVSTAAFAQGTITFNTRVLADDGVSFLVNAVVTDRDSGAAVSGATYLAQLYVGATSGNLSAVGSPVVFRTGTRAGYVDISDTTVTTALAAGSTAFVKMYAWEASKGSSYDEAAGAFGKVGFSNEISLTLGGSGSPPSVPTNLVGLQGFSVAVVPEPATLALAGIGGLGLLVMRRKQA